MIVVAGGSGRLGRLVVGSLLDQGERVRVLAREAERTRALLGDDVEVITGDVRERHRLDAVLAGASVVVSAVHGFLGGRGAGPLEVDDRGNANLVDAAAATGADVVLVSVIGAERSSLDLFRAKHAAEQHLRASGTGWTIVRSGPFLETWLSVLSESATSERPMIFGRGDQPVPFVSAVDVAEVVSHAATDVRVRGQVLEVAGEPMTLNELASALQSAHGWHGAPRHVPRPVLRVLGTLARPISPAFARQNRVALAMDTTSLGHDTEHGTDLATALGRPPRRVAAVLAEHGR